MSLIPDNPAPDEHTTPAPPHALPHSCSTCSASSCKYPFDDDSCYSSSSNSQSSECPSCSDDSDSDDSAPQTPARSPHRRRPAGRRRASAASSTLSCTSSSEPPLLRYPRAAQQPTLALPGRLARSAHSATTLDGWRLHLHRVALSVAAGGPQRNFPVILCPGLASGGVESFDLDPGSCASMAAFLAERGYDVWWVRSVDLLGRRFDSLWC